MKTTTILIKYNTVEFDVGCPRCNFISYPDRDYHTVPLIHCPNCNLHSPIDISNGDLKVPKRYRRVPREEYEDLFREYFALSNFDERLKKRHDETICILKKNIDSIKVYIIDVMKVTRIIPENLLYYYSEVPLTQQHIEVLCKVSRYPQIERDYGAAQRTEITRVDIEGYQRTEADKIEIVEDSEGNVCLQGFREWRMRSTRPLTEEEKEKLKNYPLFKTDVELDSQEKILFADLEKCVKYNADELLRLNRQRDEEFGKDTPSDIKNRYFNVSVRCDTPDILQPCEKYPENAVITCPGGIIVAEYTRPDNSTNIFYYHCDGLHAGCEDCSCYSDDE